MLARGVSQPGLWPGRRHGSPLPVTGRPQAASSDFLSDIVLGTESTGFVEDLVDYGPRLRPMISFMISVVPPNPAEFLMGDKPPR